MQNPLQKVLNLARKTGDRIVVFDNENPENTYVVMDIDEYEKILFGRNEVKGLTDNQLLDKINRDIAMWKSENDFEDSSDSDSSFFNSLQIDEMAEKKGKKGWSIPKDVKESAEEIMEEDRQYLEEVTF
ncbi:MAG: hypothetical protein AAB906_04495 [Patescibacteria group bacterium]